MARGRQMRLGPLARVAFVAGKFRPAAEEVRRAALLTGIFPGHTGSIASGPYLARTSCTDAMVSTSAEVMPFPTSESQPGIRWSCFRSGCGGGKSSATVS